MRVIHQRIIDILEQRTEPTSTSSGELFQAYQLPNGALIDLDKYAELLIQIEPPDDAPEPDDPYPEDDQ